MRAPRQRVRCAEAGLAPCDVPLDVVVAAEELKPARRWRFFRQIGDLLADLPRVGVVKSTTRRYGRRVAVGVMPAGGVAPDEDVPAAVRQRFGERHQLADEAGFLGGRYV